MKRATSSDCFLSFAHSDFNPRPREEGDDMYDAAKDALDKISIHALVKRATTRTSEEVINGIKISIHALVKRATIP